MKCLIFLVLFYGIIMLAGVIEIVCKKVARYIYCRIGASYLKEQATQELYMKKSRV